MRAREYLSQVYALEHDIKRDKRILQSLEMDAYFPAGINYDKDRVQSSGGKTLDDIIIRLNEQREKLIVEETHRIELYNKIRDEVNGMPGDNRSQVLQKEVLKLKYLDHKNFVQIANTLIVDTNYAYKLHERGCRAFEDIYLKRSSLSENVETDAVE